MAKSIKNIIATLFVVILLCKSVLMLVGAFAQHKHVAVIEQTDPAESDNAEHEAEQKSAERVSVHDDFADLVSPLLMYTQKILHQHYISAEISPLTDLGVITPPPECA